MCRNGGVFLGIDVNKCLVILFAVILTASIVMATDAVYSSIVRPSVPEFTVKYVDYSYDVPNTYGIDQYTGEKVIVECGYHVDKRTIEVTIKNQHFSSYEDTDGNLIALYYNFRYKGSYGDGWTYYPFDPNYHTSKLYGGLGGSAFPKFPASNSDYTVAVIEVIQLEGLRDAPIYSKVDFQVQALIGYIDHQYTGLLAGCPYYFVGEKSEWSDTQTFTVSESQTSTPDESQTSMPLNMTTSETPEQSESQTPNPSNTTTLGIPEQQDIETETQQTETILTQQYTKPETTQLTLIAAVALIAIPVAAGLGLLIHLNRKTSS